MLCSVVRSYCENVIHALISNSPCTCDDCDFLPGFIPVMANSGFGMESPAVALTASTDHVTYVCRSGESKNILDWYSRCFGMKRYTSWNVCTTTPATSIMFLNRFLVSSAENVATGVEIGGEVGMRMTVGEWISSWLCREEGVQFPKSEDDDDRCKNNIQTSRHVCFKHILHIS